MRVIKLKTGTGRELLHNNKDPMCLPNNLKFVVCIAGATNKRHHLALRLGLPSRRCSRRSTWETGMWYCAFRSAASKFETTPRDDDLHARKLLE